MQVVNNQSTLNSIATTTLMHGNPPRSIDSLYQLLKSRVFYKANYASWLFDCMLHATLPIHPKFSLLIKEFVYCVFTVDKLDRIPEEWIQPHLDQVHLMQPAHILLTLYMLQFNDAVLSIRTDPSLTSLVSSSSLAPPPPQQHGQIAYTLLDITNKIPLRAMLNYVETTQASKAYSALYPDLINLTANLYPELLDVVSFLLYDGKASFDHALQGAGLRIPLEKVEQVLLDAKHSPKPALKALAYLQTVPLKDMYACTKMLISTLLLPCLDSDMDWRIVDAFISAWEYYHLSLPHEIWLWTTNTLVAPHQTAPYTFDDLIRSPLVVFKADQRIFRSKRLLLLWLHVLSCLRTCSKHGIWKRFHTVYPRPDSRINGRNVMALVNAQDSTMLQLLLEICQEKKEDEHNQAVLMNARKLICRFIHGVFIDDRDSLLIKAFHFQTYATNLIPMMVDLVPSMFITHSFLNELTRQPQFEKQVFGIILGCHLCEKYPTEIYRSLAEKSILPRLLKIAFPPASGTDHPQCAPSDYLLQIIPAYKHLACAFPHFGQQILKALHEVQAGLPAGPQAFMGNEGSNKIILFLQLHKALKETIDEVTIQLEQKDSVNKSLLAV